MKTSNKILPFDCKHYNKEVGIKAIFYDNGELGNKKWQLERMIGCTNTSCELAPNCPYESDFRKEYGEYTMRKDEY